MSHRFRTFASPLHWAHHRNPNAVFTVGAWIPSIAAWLLLIASFGLAPAVLFYSGLLAGFIGYELLHYRIHFAQPSCALEERLRAHHLVHHLREPERCFGVSTTMWDRFLGSDPPLAEMAKLATAVNDTPPLSGPSNFRRI